MEQLQDPEQHPTLVLDAFILRATEHAGWGLSLFHCANCQAPAGVLGRAQDERVEDERGVLLGVLKLLQGVAGGVEKRAAP
ncbi:DNA repair protein RecO C-terminal domain-containing protein, partial [Corynebacterium sanguinis]|uniref:DNA repair protein RecO C-terminal domain-containing protein n=1 Tax=Corynebacterium sanguinis TaxID=2594913 RepID=UPI0035A83A3C